MDWFFEKRAVRLFWAFVLVFISLAGHLAYIQLYAGDELSSQAVSQQSQAVPLEVPARGLILDRHLRPLTEYREVWRAAVFPAAVEDKDAGARLLAAVLKTTPDRAKVYLQGKARLISVDLNEDQVAEIHKRDISGIMAVKVKMRLRKPLLASHTLGYLGLSDSSEWSGQMGIESIYDRELAGKRPESLIRAFFDARGRFIKGIGFKSENSRPDPERKNVVLTIDRDIQEVLEKVLDESGVIDGAAVVLEAGTGDIVAMASRPDYSLEPAQDFGYSAPVINEKVYVAAYDTVNNAVYNAVYDIPAGAGAGKGSFLNKAISPYQPGSVFKMVVAAAALEEGIVEPDSLYLCVGEKDELVKCYEKGGHGLITFAEAVAYSCNPTFARVGLRLGAEKLISYAQKFGLGKEDIIGFREGESTGRLMRIKERYNLVNASLGQWPVEASAVQVAAMTAAIANDGVYIPPRLVREVRNPDGSVNRFFRQEKGVRVVSEKTAKTLQTMLEGVTREGTGWKAWVEPWGSAGKTGSAQVGSEKIDAWFTGYAPLNEPRYIVTVLVNNGQSGGQTAAPVFRKVMTEILDLKPEK